MYTRVMPRDLFNEANLLKCLGKIVLLIENNAIPGLKVIGYDIDCGFTIDQDPNDGSISVTNLSFRDHSDELCNEVHFRVGLNSREPWPLIMHYRGSEYFPLNSEGEWQCSDTLFTKGR